MVSRRRWSDFVLSQLFCVAAALLLGLPGQGVATAVASEPAYSPAFQSLEDELRTRFLGALRHATHVHPAEHDDAQLWALRRIERDFRLDLDYNVRREARVAQQPMAAGLLRMGHPAGVTSVAYRDRSLQEALAGSPGRSFLQSVYYLYVTQLRHAAAQCKEDEKEQNLAFLDFVARQDWSDGMPRYRAVPYEMALDLYEHDCIDAQTFKRFVSPYVVVLLTQIKQLERPGDRLRPLFLLAAGGMLRRVEEPALLQLLRMQNADGSWPGADFDGGRAAAAQGAYVLAAYLTQQDIPPRQADLLTQETPVLPATDWRRPAPP